MWYVVGLGNPGEEYELTRHNTGRIILKAVAKEIGAADFAVDAKFRSEISEGKIKKEKIMLIAPDTFMNKSGLAVAPLKLSEKKAAQVIVIQDDFNFPVGKFKISFNRSSGGHNGVESVIKALKTEGFIRVRVGICPATPSGKLKLPHGATEVEKLILGEFKKPELDILKKLGKKVAESIEVIVTEGLQKAMTEFNQ